MVSIGGPLAAGAIHYGTTGNVLGAAGAAYDAHTIINGPKGGTGADNSAYR